MRAYGMAFDEAEARKKGGDLPDNYVPELLTPFLESAAMEVTRAIQFFYTSTPYTRVDQLLSLIHISEPTRRTPISYAVFCLRFSSRCGNRLMRIISRTSAAPGRRRPGRPGRRRATAPRAPTRPAACP